MDNKYSAISLFSGAGGMDLGFENAGINVLWSNEIDKDASISYQLNRNKSIMRNIDILEGLKELKYFKNTDIVFGGPPCQGFSIAGKMDPTDIRNNLIWTFLKAVDIVQPKAFVMENVKALLTHSKWEDVRKSFINSAQEMGYTCHTVLLNSVDFGVPQKRERVFFIGFKNKEIEPIEIQEGLIEYNETPKTLREIISTLEPAGSLNNPLTCTAKITLANNPVLRKSPYAGMLFNGAGRPVNLDGHSNTLPASMGGNKTPIIDEKALRNKNDFNWIEKYHKAIIENKITPEFKHTPSRLRRLTIKEAALIQTFPLDYKFYGSKSSIYKQIGNAVPIKLAEAVGKFIVKELSLDRTKISQEQLSFDIL